MLELNSIAMVVVDSLSFYGFLTSGLAACRSGGAHTKQLLPGLRRVRCWRRVL
jgi:hypothetical protein